MALFLKVDQGSRECPDVVAQALFANETRVFLWRHLFGQIGANLSEALMIDTSIGERVFGPMLSRPANEFICGGGDHMMKECIVGTRDGPSEIGLPRFSSARRRN